MLNKGCQAFGYKWLSTDLVVYRGEFFYSYDSNNGIFGFKTSEGNDEKVAFYGRKWAILIYR